MGGFENLIQGIIVFLLIALIVMLILRELWCWYFKLNKIVSLLTEIRDSLNRQEEPVMVSGDLRASVAENNHPARSDGEYQMSKEPQFFSRG